MGHECQVDGCHNASFYGLDLDFDDLIVIIHLCPEHERQAFGGDAAIAEQRPRLERVKDNQ